MNLVKILKELKSGEISFIKSFNSEKKLNYQELYLNSLKALSFLKENNLKSGDKLIFQFNDNENFVVIFWACLIGKIIPVPLSIGNNEEHKLKLIKIYNFLDEAYIISDTDISSKLKNLSVDNLNIINFTSIIDRIDKYKPYKDIEKIEEEEIAFIQFSSGSTDEPKGVVLTHKNLLHNLKSFSISANINRVDSFLSWFPLTHDMGLIGWHLVPLYNNVNQTLIQTNLFVRKPNIWLEIANRFKSTILCSPNFGYRHFLKLFKNNVNWDLSNIRLIFNGAEPISANLCDEFLNKLSDYGLKNNTIYTVYGLAEASLAVSFPTPETKFKKYTLDINSLSIGNKVKDVINGITYVDVGFANYEFEIRIINENREVLKDNFVGYIEIKSKSVMQGYYKNEKATKKVLRDGWLDSGDLGFIRNKRLIIVGRAKDLIIINANNYYPHDIERVATEVEGIELNKIVACGVRDKNNESEDLILFVLFKKDESEFIEIEEKLKEYILKQIGLVVKEVVLVKKMPKTTSGKLQRFKLKEKYSKDKLNNNTLKILINEAENLIDENEEIDINKPLLEQGFDSIKLIAFVEKVSKKLNIDTQITAIFDYPSLKEFANYLIDEKKDNYNSINFQENSDIAIIGMGCRFANANNPKEFWDLLKNSIDIVGKVPKNRWDSNCYGSFLSDIDKFDNNFFDISDIEATFLDPQQRILLEVTMEALENSGINTDNLKGTKTGVFIGISNSDYAMRTLRDKNNIDAYSLTGNMLSTASGRISYTFGLNGANMSIDTACSSSLTAIHLAIQSLQSNESTVAIAGGVNLILTPDVHIALSQTDAISKSGKCKTFDRDADGYVRGEGCGIIILKPLQQALKDSDNILAIIKASSINHDGKSNGLTAPNGLAQQNLIRETLSKANLKPSDISYIETHGTATNLGDPIEVNAISNIFDNLLIGSVKSNIGHLESSAGIVGIIKSILVLNHEIIPPNLHFNNPNPHINFKNIKVVDKKINFKRGDKVRYIGVSSFGFSGTNAHVILSEAPKITKIKKKFSYKLLTLSAKSITTLEKVVINFEKFLRDSEFYLNNIIYTASIRTHYKYRVAFLGETKEELLEVINSYLKGKINKNCFIKSINKDIILSNNFKTKKDFENLAQFYVNSKNINFSEIYKGYKVVLPNYPFDKKSFWIEDKNNKIKLEEKRVNLTLQSLKDMIFKINSAISIEDNAKLFELGLDSLGLLQLRNFIKKEFKIEIVVKDFYSKLTTLTKLSNYINNEKSRINIYSKNNNINKDSSSSIEDIFVKQIDLMNNIFKEQLKVLENSKDIKLKNDNKYSKILNYNLLKQIKTTKDNLTLTQESFINKFIKKYNLKTLKSKNFANINRKKLADWIHTITFRSSIKEIIYPIVAKSANGSKFIDIDGNEYLDLSMGYGSNFFGHNQEFINKKISKILQDGFVLAPLNPLISETVGLITEFTKSERVCFTNSGTEAVMATLRLVRAINKRNKIIKFKGSYHGTFDGVLATTNEDITTPISLGIPNGMVEDIIEFNYGSDKVFDYIKANSDEVAGVLVEPVQSRRPEFVPIEFLRELREITKKFDIALIFDEMITGFRYAKGGVQEIFNIKADVGIYGKAIANSMPIGVIAGSSRYLDGFDGGFWEYGDDSFPQKDMVTFGGTFCKHPLVLASICAGLSEMKQKDYHSEINFKTKKFADEVNEFFESENIPIKINHFGSLFKFESYEKYALVLNPIEMNLFFYILMYKGVYTWEKRICFFSVAHSNDDINNLIKKIKEVISELREGGFFNENINYELIPATSFQHRLFVLSQFKQSNLNYQQNIAWKVEYLNIDKTKNIFQKIINRHESLRTAFEFKNEKLYQKIYNNVKIDFRVVEANENEIKNLIYNFTHTPFDLSKSPLIKFLIIKLLNNKYILAISNHHTIFDGGSIDILIKEFEALYRDEKLIELEKQYSDFAKEYSDFLISKEFKKQEVFWLNKLKDTKNLNLPIDNSYPSIRSNIGDIVEFRIDKKLTNSLKKLAKNSNATINMILIASFNIMLSKLVNQNEIVIAMPVTNREYNYFNTIGMFANTVGLKTNINLNSSFDNYLNEIKKELLNLMDNLNYPLEILFEKLEIKRDISKNPLFNTIFVYEKSNSRDLKLNNQNFHRYKIKKDRVDFDLTLEIIDNGEILNASYEYYSEIFDKESINRYVEYYKNILTTISSINNNNTKIKNIDMLGVENRLITSFNKTQSSLINKTIIDVFNEQVIKTPNNIALIYKDTQLTYSELNIKSNEIANYLIDEFDIKGDDLIALILDRSEYLIISILAILKAGGAYISIDPTYPKERIDFILEDAKPKIILNNEKLKEINYSNRENPNINIDTNNLAYIIYTSGTTGKPKGVMIEHKNVVERLKSDKLKFDFNEQDVWITLHSSSFDFFVWEMYGALLYGAKLIVADSNEVKDVEKFLNLIKLHKVTILNQTPSYFYQLIKIHKDNSDLSEHLRYIIFGGEKLDLHYLKPWVNKYPLEVIKLINMYGITETTIHVTFYQIQKEDLEKNRSIIGTPLPNTQVFILDDNLKPVPIGVISQMYINGVGVARGYLNQYELTKERFINHSKFGIIYNSGDLAKYLSDGNIEYLGRVDEQIKLRGFRIELDEIKNTILNYPQILQVEVLLKEIKDDNYLVAYYISSLEIKNIELRDFLSKKLPEYMIPNHFIKVDKFNLTPNGKVDKKSFPNFELKKSEYIEPKDELQEKLAKIFENILNNSKISINDNFFELGGQSIKAMQILSKIYQSLNIRVSLEDIFKYPTIKELSYIIKSTTKFNAPKIEVLKADSYELSSAQNRLWVVEHLQELSSAYNMAGVFEIEGDLNTQILEKSIQALINRHEILRTNFLSDIPKQIVKDSIEFKLKTLEFDNLELANIYIISEAKKPFNLEKDLLIRVILIKVDNSSKLFINKHHIISDGKSIEIMLRDLSEYYSAFSQNRKPNLLKLKFQYKDYSAWQNSFLTSNQSLEDREYWLNKFKDKPKPLNILNKIRPENLTFNGDEIITKVDNSIFIKIRKFIKIQRVTLFTFLSSVIKTFLYLQTKERDITIGSVMDTRDEWLENQIGFFVNTIALRDIINPEDNFLAILHKTQKSLLESYSHNGYPLDKLVSELNLKRDLNRSPLFDILLSFETIDLEYKFDNLTLKREDLNLKNSKFDINFHFREINDKLFLTLEYRVELFNESEIIKIRDEVLELLNTLIDNNKPISNIKKFSFSGLDSYNLKALFENK